jgi:hypothetical protein
MCSWFYAAFQNCAYGLVPSHVYGREGGLAWKKDFSVLACGRGHCGAVCRGTSL